MMWWKRSTGKERTDAGRAKTGINRQKRMNLLFLINQIVFKTGLKYYEGAGG